MQAQANEFYMEYKMDIKELRPVGEMVLVKDLEEERTLKSGLILTADLNRHSKTAEVVAVGAGEINKHTGSRIPMSVETGDNIIYTAYAGVATWREGEDNYTLLREADILAIKQEG